MSRYVDFSYIPENQHAIHDRLVNWAKWVSVRSNGWQTHPMWRKALTSRQWDVDPHIPQALDTLDALLIEKTVSQLPDKHRDSVRWAYVAKTHCAPAARRLGLTIEALYQTLADGRSMVSNRVSTYTHV